jgi:ribosomal protein S18 acetylase RimI-like enzyme
MITIRHANTDEVKKLQDLNDKAFVANPGYDPDLVLDWAQSDIGKTYFTTLLSNSTHICLVAEDGNRLVGYIAAAPKVIPHRKSRYIEIENLGVVPEYQAKGVGTQLMDTCLEWARSQGYQKVYLVCYAANKPAITFYEAKGFLPIEIDFEKDI